MQYRKGICRECNSEQIITNRSKMLCHKHNQERLMQGKPEKKVAPKQKRKATGEALLFLALAEVRPHVCFVCGSPLRPITYSSMAHVLSKKQYPDFRLNSKNIVFLCPPLSENKCHYKYDFEPLSNIIDRPEWKPFFELKERLLDEYKNLK